MQHVTNPVTFPSFYIIIFVRKKKTKVTYSMGSTASSEDRRFVPRRIQTLSHKISLVSKDYGEPSTVG